MQVVLSATLSPLYCVLGVFHMSIDTLVQNFCSSSFLISILFSLALNLHVKSHLGVVMGTETVVTITIRITKCSLLRSN